MTDAATWIFVGMYLLAFVLVLQGKGKKK